MKTNRLSKLACLALVCFVTLGTRAQTVTQTIPLTNGWNAIWVEVEPTNNDIGVVFTNLPVESVWPYSDKLTSVEFIKNLDEAPWNDPGWRRWFPPDSPHAILTTLFTVNANRAYLVKMTNAANLVLTGRPSVQGLQWVPDSFNLCGFRVSPDSPPTFAGFLGHSAAHAGQPAYRLNAALGVWQLVNPAEDRIRSGEAYWVYCQGASSYSGPLEVKLDQGDGLDFGVGIKRKELAMKALPLEPVILTVKEVAPQPSSPLSYISDTTNGPVAQALPPTLTTNLSEQQTQTLQLAIRRKDLPAQTYQTVLEITDNLGSRVLVPVSAEKVTAASLGSTTPFAGLWVGSASVSNVCEVNSLVNPTNPTPTKSAFDLRLLIHVDTNGTARFLKEVIQMWQNGTTTNNPGGFAVTEQPGHYVLVTDDSLISRFEGASLRDGVPVGRRISSVGFDFEGGTNNTLTMAGTFGTGTNACDIVLSPDFSTNPFRHKYHPDHDNLDAQFVAMTPDATGSKEAYRIVRQLRLEFAAQDPEGTSSVQSLDYGYDVIGGTYRETVTGLHNNPIVAEGRFRLNRVAVTGVLNQ